MTKLNTAAIIAPLLVLGALTTTSAQENESEDDSRIGQEVDRICFGRSINGWRSVNGQGRAVLLEKGVNDWYLVGVSGPCTASDFRFAETIGIDSRPSGGCVSRGDTIIVASTGRSINRCFIRKINERDEKTEPDSD